MMKKSCPKCQGAMSEGFVPTESDSSGAVTKWVEGRPDKRWYGLKVRGKAQFTIRSFRCARCGFLENYALD